MPEALRKNGPRMGCRRIEMQHLQAQVESKKEQLAALVLDVGHARAVASEVPDRQASAAERPKMLVDERTKQTERDDEVDMRRPLAAERATDTQVLEIELTQRKANEEKLQGAQACQSADSRLASLQSSRGSGSFNMSTSDVARVTELEGKLLMAKKQIVDLSDRADHHAREARELRRELDSALRLRELVLIADKSPECLTKAQAT